MNYGARFIHPSPAADRAHVFGHLTPRTVQEDLVFDWWNGPTSAARVACVNKDGRYYSKALAAGDILYAASSAVVTGLKRLDSLAIGTAAQVLRVNGGASAPEWHTLTYGDVGADAAGAAATVQGNLNTHSGLTGASVHGLGTASTHAASDFDAAGAAAAVTATTLGLVIGTNTQAHNVKLDSIAALASAAGWLHNNGSGTFAYSTPSYSDVGADAAGAAAAITLAGLGGVPTSRTVNSKALSSNITLTYADVGADAAGAAAAITLSGLGGITKAQADGYYDALGAAAAVTLAGLGGVPTTRTVAGHALSSNVTVSKSDVGLSAVENTALSTWAGSSNITTLGTIAGGLATSGALTTGGPVNGVAKPWKFGEVVTTPVSFNGTRYVRTEIDGVEVRLATI